MAGVGQEAWAHEEHLGVPSVGHDGAQAARVRDEPRGPRLNKVDDGEIRWEALRAVDGAHENLAAFVVGETSAVDHPVERRFVQIDLGSVEAGYGNLLLCAVQFRQGRVSDSVDCDAASKPDVFAVERGFPLPFCLCTLHVDQDTLAGFAERGAMLEQEVVPGLRFSRPGICVNGGWLQNC